MTNALEHGEERLALVATVARASTLACNQLGAYYLHNCLTKLA